jgi:hypothetical protein
MDNYIVRIYRRNEEGPQDVAGLVEKVEDQRSMNFRSSSELLEILKGAPVKQDKREEKSKNT